MTAALGIIAIAVSIFVLGWLALGGRATKAVRHNLERGIEDAPAAGGGAPEVIPRPGPSLLVRITPASTMHRLAGMAGRGAVAIGGLHRVLAMKLVLVIIALAGGLAIVLTLRTAAGYAISVVLLVGAYYAPEVLERARVRARTEAIEAGLADILDQLTIAVEAGLGFEAAVARVARNSSGPLAEELVRTLQDTQLGMSRREAYTALARRTAAPDLGRFVRAVVQADAYGIPISTVLRTQSAEARLKRRQDLEEQAQRIPVMVTFPLMVCLMPVLFIIVLGPALIGVMGSLG